MRDIRPNPISRRRRTLPDLPADEDMATLPEKPVKSVPKTKFSGSHVPVTSVHVSKQIIPKRAADVLPAKKHEIIPASDEALAAEIHAAHKDKRPLFAKPKTEA